MKKLFLIGFVVLGFAFALTAESVVRIDFSCEDFFGTLTSVGDLPRGVMIGPRAEFWDKSRKGFTYPVYVDVAKCPSFEATFLFAGKGKVRMYPAVTASKVDAGRKLEVVAFEIDGDKSSRVPCAFQQWTSLMPFISATAKVLPGTRTNVKAGQKYWRFFVSDGRKINVKASFRVSAK